MSYITSTRLDSLNEAFHMCCSDFNSCVRVKTGAYLGEGACGAAAPGGKSKERQSKYFKLKKNHCLGSTHSELCSQMKGNPVNNYDRFIIDCLCYWRPLCLLALGANKPSWGERKTLLSSQYVCLLCNGIDSC